MRVRTQCRACGLPYKERLRREQPELTCPGCGLATPLEHAGWTEGPPAAVSRCPLCGCRHLYRQRDLNRGLGCLLVALGAALVPWTYGLSLVALGLVDLVLYHRLRVSVVCYRCDTVFRDARPGPRQGEFDLLKHDVLKYGKSWAELEDEDPADEGQPRGG